MIAKLIYESKSLNILFVLLLAVFGNIHQLFMANYYHTNISLVLPMLRLFLNISPWLSFIIYQSIALLVAFQISNVSKLYSNHFSIFLPSIIWLILVHIYPVYFVNPTNVIVLPFILVLINLLFEAYEKKHVQNTLFLFGFILGVLLIINSDAILIAPLLYLWLLNFRQFNIKEYILPLIGTAVPIVLADATWYISNIHQNSSLFTSFIHTLDLKDFNLPLLPLFSSLFIFAFSTYRLINYRNSLKKIKERKYYLWIIFCLIYLWIMFIILDNQFIFFTINIFLSILVSILIVSFQNSMYSKLFFIGILLLNFVSILIML